MYEEYEFWPDGYEEDDSDLRNYCTCGHDFRSDAPHRDNCWE